MTRPCHPVDDNDIVLCGECDQLWSPGDRVCPDAEDGTS